MSEETNTGIPAAPTVPSDIYTPLEPLENEAETAPENTDDRDDHKDVKRPRLNAEVDPNSPQAYGAGADDDVPRDTKRPAPRTPGDHAFDRGFEYDDEDAG